LFVCNYSVDSQITVVHVFSALLDTIVISVVFIVFW